TPGLVPHLNSAKPAGGSANAAPAAMAITSIASARWRIAPSLSRRHRPLGDRADRVGAARLKSWRGRADKRSMVVRPIRALATTISVSMLLAGCASTLHDVRARPDA